MLDLTDRVHNMWTLQYKHVQNSAYQQNMRRSAFELFNHLRPAGGLSTRGWVSPLAQASDPMMVPSVLMAASIRGDQGKP